MNDEPLPNDGATVSHEDVEVSRRLTRKGKGIVGVVEIRPIGGKPMLMVHVVDEFPDGLPIEAVGFNSEAKPEGGNITPEGVSLKQTIEDDPVRIQYGIKLTEPVEAVQFDPPTIRGVETAEFTRSTASRTDEGKGTVANTDGVDESSSSLSSIMSIFGRSSSGAKDEDDREPSDSTRAGPSDAPRIDGRDSSDESDDERASYEATETTDDADDPDEIEIETAKTDDNPGSVDIDESDDSSEPMAGDETKDSSESIGTDESGDGDPLEEAIRTAVEADEPEETEGETARADASSDERGQVDSETADSDGAGAASGAEIEARTEGGVESKSVSGGDGTDDDRDGESSPPGRRSVEARLDQLTVRVEKFAAYATSLEDLIDEHGPASEFIELTRGELAELDEELQSVRREVESVRADHGEELVDLQEQTDAIDQRIRSARNALGMDVENVREHVGRVEGHVDRVEEQVDDIHDHVDRVDDEVGRIDDDVSRVDEEIGRLDADLVEQRSAVEHIDDDVEALTDRVAEVETDLRSVRKTVSSVESDVSTVSEDVGTMRDELESLRAEVEAFNDVRRTLATAFDLPTEAEAPADD